MPAVIRGKERVKTSVPKRKDEEAEAYALLAAVQTLNQEERLPTKTVSSTD